MKRINSIEDVYQSVEKIKSEARKCNQLELIRQLDDSLNLGSSGLEILGAIREVLLKDRKLIEQLIGFNGKSEVSEIITFIDKSFGR